MIQKFVPALVSEADNNMLAACPTLDEVKAAVFSLNKDSAAGPHVYNFVLQFFTQCWIMPNLNSNLLVLIPKIKGQTK